MAVPTRNPPSRKSSTPDGEIVLPPQPLPLTRLPLASSVKNFKPWPPHRCAVSSAPQTLLPERSQGVLGIPSPPLTSARSLGAEGFLHLVFLPQLRLLSTLLTWFLQMGGDSALDRKGTQLLWT